MANSPTRSNDPANALKGQSRIVSFEGCEIWFCGDQVVLDSRVPLPDLRLREFARPRILFEGSCYYLSEKSQSSDRQPVYRFVLTPWPKNDPSITRTLVLDEEYFRNLLAARKHTVRESIAFRLLVNFYPVLGFLWSGQKRMLNRLGFEAHAISTLSVYVGFMTEFVSALFLIFLAFPMPLVIGTVVFLVDAVARMNRLLMGEDSIPPGFYEWLLRRKDRFG